MSTITIACDVDGVIAPVTLVEPAPGCITLPRVNHGTQVLTRAVSALKGWVETGASVAWHSTWRGAYTDELARVLSLEGISTFASDEEFLHPTPEHSWWKLAAVDRWLRQRPADSDERLIWIDDDINDAIVAGEIAGEILADRRLQIISPDLSTGLTEVEIDFISSLIATRISAPLTTGSRL